MAGLMKLRKDTEYPLRTFGAAVLGGNTVSVTHRELFRSVAKVCAAAYYLRKRRNIRSHRMLTVPLVEAAWDRIVDWFEESEIEDAVYDCFLETDRAVRYGALYLARGWAGQGNRRATSLVKSMLQDLAETKAERAAEAAAKAARDASRAV
jgi:hypothetical protein